MNNDCGDEYAEQNDAVVCAARGEWTACAACGDEVSEDAVDDLGNCAGCQEDD